MQFTSLRFPRGYSLYHGVYIYVSLMELKNKAHSATCMIGEEEEA
jgi:hypothetical protein